MRITRLALAMCAAVALLAVVVGSAAASTAIGFEPAGGLSAVSEGRVTFEETGLGIARVMCRATLNGALGKGLEKAGSRRLPEGVFGEITEGRASECTEGLGESAEVRFLAEVRRPYNARYNSFLGTLPNITGILFTSLETRIQALALGRTCVYEGALDMLASETGGRTRFNQIRIQETGRLRLVSGEGCPREGTLRGTFRLSTAQTVVLRSSALTIGRLIGEPNPVVIRREQSRHLLELTNTGELPVEVERVHLEEREGQVTATAESACARILGGRTCLVTVEVGTEPRARPANGEIVIDYVWAGRGQRLKIRYEAQV